MAKTDLDDVMNYLPVIVMGLAVVSAFMSLGTWVIPAIVIGGLLVGFKNINKDEVVPFLVATLAIAGASTVLASIPSVGPFIGQIFQNLAIAAGSIAIVPAAKTIWEMSSK